MKRYIGSTNNPLIDTFLGSHHLSSWFCIDIVRLKFLDSIVNLNLESFWSKWIHHHAEIHHSWRRINICYTLQRQSFFLVWNNNLWTISIVSTDWSSFFTSFQGHASETQLSSNFRTQMKLLFFWVFALLKKEKCKENFPYLFMNERNRNS